MELLPACRLSVQAVACDGTPARVILLPDSGTREVRGLGRAAFPWSELDALELTPGGTLELDGLPPGRVRVLVLHARGSGRSPAVSLVPGETTLVRVPLDPCAPLTCTFGSG